jgi:hypothetical protein
MRQPVEIQVENVYPGRPLNMLRWISKTGLKLNFTYIKEPT